MRTLVVEDDPVLGGVLSQALIDWGWRVDWVVNAQQARHIWAVQAFDAVVLDLNLPDGSGLDVLRWARGRKNNTPVLILTARNRTEERVAGLNAGADDYLGKPFELSEIQARLHALHRRANGGEDQVVVGALVYDRLANRFFIQTDQETLQPLELPAREFSVLQLLMSPPGRVFSKRALSDKLSGFDDALGDNAIEAFISRLRRKLAHSGTTIRTLRGLGYLIEPTA